MALTQSTMLALGTQAPDFNLMDVVSGNMLSLKDFADKDALLVMFICSHCPYVKHIEKGLVRLGRDYQGKSLAIVGISSNDRNYDYEDAPEGLKRQAQKEGFNFSYLYDESQEVAKAYTAACTPDFYLFGKDRKLVYRGQFDDSRPGNGVPVNGKDVRAAIEATLKDNEVNSTQKPSAGCNIKWKPGNTPSYF